MTTLQTTDRHSIAENRDIFVARFFLGGARPHIRKTTVEAPWLSLGILENMNPMVFYESRLFSNLNIIAGADTSLGHGLIHGYLAGSAEIQIKRAVKNLNALPAEEIIFYHDESLCGLAQAGEMGLSLAFTPVSLLQWLVRILEENRKKLRPLGLTVAVQLPCSTASGTDRNEFIDRIFELTGVTRVSRKFDRGNRICCAARGYYGIVSFDAEKDADVADKAVTRNIEDAQKAGAGVLVTLCPMCFAALAPAARATGLIPLQIESLVNLALYGEALPEGLIFS